jgi:hypothetical protein
VRERERERVKVTSLKKLSINEASGIAHLKQPFHIMLINLKCSMRKDFSNSVWCKPF